MALSCDNRCQQVNIGQHIYKHVKTFVDCENAVVVLVVLVYVYLKKVV